MKEEFHSWGRYPKVTQKVIDIHWRSDSFPDINTENGYLPYGMGRSYGDVCLNHEGVILHTAPMARYISFDEEKGTIRCDAGVCLHDLLQFIVPKGWFVPVTPGTRYVTLGGMIANDIHGKNHHRVGTFGSHINCFEILRSDGSRKICSESENSELFAATVGGLGLTGLITWAEIRLSKVDGPYIDTETIRFENLAGFFEISQESDKAWEYTVAWIDSLASGKNLGRGLFMRGNHSARTASNKAVNLNQKLTVSFDAPSYLLNKHNIKLFNSVFYHKQFSGSVKTTQLYDKFFYPLDGIGQWNRLYGKTGMLQYQCVVPYAAGYDAMSEILSQCVNQGQGSFLSVLKIFGRKKSPGLLSFPREGVTLALDFPNRGKRTFALLDTLDNIVLQAGGAVYPAKDARMESTSFKEYFPNWKKFAEHIDPHFSSSFWRRVMGQGGQ